jgi:hypothetical protein
VLGTSTNNLAADMEAASKKLAAGVPMDHALFPLMPV